MDAAPMAQLVRAPQGYVKEHTRAEAMWRGQIQCSEKMACRGRGREGGAVHAKVGTIMEGRASLAVPPKAPAPEKACNRRIRWAQGFRGTLDWALVTPWRILLDLDQCTAETWAGLRKERFRSEANFELGAQGAA